MPGPAIANGAFRHHRRRSDHGGTGQGVSKGNVTQALVVARLRNNVPGRADISAVA